MAFQFIMIWAYPKFIAPLFNKFSKLDDEDLTQEIDKLSKRCDINFKDYFVMNASLRSSHGNAYFTGFGKNKRIVFFDTLLKSLNVDEVVSVLAHELGHLKKKHIIKSIIMSSAFLFIGLFILGQLYNSPKLFEAFSLSTNEAYMALLLFVLIAPYYTFLLTPLMSWLSRKNEFEADEFAATHASAKKLITALLKMYKDNSSSLTPHPTYSKFYYSHPPAKERIDFLKKFST
jgi:STE24 endopeptidase